MRLRSRGMTISVITALTFAIGCLITFVPQSVDENAIPETLLASTRGGSTNTVLVNGMASCVDNEIYNQKQAGNGQYVGYDQCYAANTPVTGPPLSCIFCQDRTTTDGVITTRVNDMTGNYTLSQGNPTICGNKRVGYCGVSPANPNVYTCQFDVAAGACGNLAPVGVIQNADGPGQPGL